MPTKTTETYEGEIEQRLRSFYVGSGLAMLKPPQVHMEISDADLKGAPSILVLFAYRGMSKPLLDSVICRVIHDIFNGYIVRGATFFGDRRTHVPLAEEIRAKCYTGSSSFPFPVPTDYIDSIKTMLENGVLRQRCNPSGNFANICRAIVNKTASIEGWAFSTTFTEALGVTPTESARPR